MNVARANVGKKASSQASLVLEIKAKGLGYSNAPVLATAACARSPAPLAQQEAGMRHATTTTARAAASGRSVSVRRIRHPSTNWPCAVLAERGPRVRRGRARLELAQAPAPKKCPRRLGRRGLGSEGECIAARARERGWRSWRAAVRLPGQGVPDSGADALLAALKHLEQMSSPSQLGHGGAGGQPAPMRASG